jgi:hypothetical protein
LECEKNYTLSNNKCILSPGCRYLSNDEKECNTCEAPYTLVDYNKCEKNPPCKTMIEGKCTYCYSYYYLSNGICKKITIDHCIAVSDSDTTTCTICENRYYLENGVCKENPEGCTNMESGKCQDCDGEHTLENGQCKKRYTNKIDHCSKYNTDDCYECDTNYILDSSTGKCKDLCKERQDLCDICDENYFTFDNGRTCENFEPKNENNNSKLNLSIISLIISIICLRIKRTKLVIIN